MYRLKKHLHILTLVFFYTISFPTAPKCYADEFPWSLFLPAIIQSEMPVHWQEGLSEGINWGIASSFNNDVGIQTHPAVLAAEDFETGTVTIATEDNRYKNLTTVVSSTSYTGTYSGEHNWVQGHNGTVARFVIPESAHSGHRPTYFIRIYFKFDNSFRPPDGESGVGVKGIGITSDPNKVGSTNNPCDGSNWYNAQAQFVGWGKSSKPQANDGYLWVGHLYSYNPYPELTEAMLGEIKVTNPAVGNKPYRLSSYATPFTYLDFGGWHSYEVGLYLNTPGKHDGEARFWIDGILQSRVAKLRYRDIEDLLPTHMNINMHRTTDDFPNTMTRWSDNIVLSTRYIGPVKKQ